MEVINHSSPPLRIANRCARVTGFTLIELMITVAIVAILAAVAYPSYTEYVRRSHRADAAAALTSAAQVMERQYTTSNPQRYPMSVSGMNTSKYAIAVSARTDNSFELQAAPIAPWTDAACGVLTLTNVGVQGKGVSGTSTATKCWGR